MKVTKEVRKKAAFLAHLAAFNGSRVLDHVAEHGSPEHNLWWKAWQHVYVHPKMRNYDTLSPILDAEAESLIRTGWTP